MEAKIILLDDLEYLDGMRYFYEDKPYTGYAYEYHENGNVWLEENFVEGFKEDICRTYYASGQIEQERHYLHSAGHGTNKEWFENGQLRKESVHEFGIRIQEKQWDSNGKLIKESHIKETDPLYNTLQIIRKKWKS